MGEVFLKGRCYRVFFEFGSVNGWNNWDWFYGRRGYVLVLSVKYIFR